MLPQILDEKNWNLRIVYKGELGEVDVDYAIDDLEEIPSLVTAGPGSDAVISIAVIKGRSAPSRTIEDLWRHDQAAAA